jgi:hypothetical protein
MGEYCGRKYSLCSVDQKIGVGIDQNKRDSPYHHISGIGYLDYD